MKRYEFMNVIYQLMYRREKKFRSEGVIEALERKKMSGFSLGNTTNLPEAQKKGRKSIQSNANKFALKIGPIIEEIKEDGYTTLREIADELNERCIETPRGGEWYAASVKNMIKRYESLR